MTLLEYLKHPKNSLIREDFTTTTLITQLKFYALLKMRRIKIYKQELDVEGCDLIIEDDNDLARKFQLKSIIVNGERKSFEIHSNILLPDRDRKNIHGFDNLVCPKTMGGVIKLIVIPKINEKAIEIKYEYTDFNIISFFADYYKRKAAINLLERLKCKNQRVYINKDLFVPLANANSLIKIAGFFNECEFDNYFYRYYELKSGAKMNSNRERELNSLLNRMYEYIKQLNNG